MVWMTRCHLILLDFSYFKMLKTKVNMEAVIYPTNGLPYSCRVEEGVEF